MPSYDYRCTNPDCLEETTEFHTMGVAPVFRCELCDYPMKKLLSAVPHKFMNPRGTMGIIHSGKGTRDDISN